MVKVAGVQGRGVVEQLLADKNNSWSVRALPRDTHSSNAKELLSQLQIGDNRPSLAAAHVHDAASLNTAFVGADASLEFVNYEIVAGKNIINAIKKNGVKHIMFSSLPDIIKGSNGKFTGAIIMNNKVEVEQTTRKELDGNFFTNPYGSMHTRLQPDGSLRLSDPIGTKNKNYITSGKALSVSDNMDTFTHITGKKAYYDL
ncbi:hypothetical protein S7711_07288 [Stachybotrys chartarum IBT 7711]|uniref:NmrA-like domain-containing protein n=1 Tax=Stachybotrys chartarum (strain CBS 109288 / IBT 7711) TaxID=1280523 RepID=A0A084BA02_STACB|nr:hypothetical protein S7711_07288 [Stachybotrys chartarum IBT 7711]